ncbi:MAG: hypothetical protein A2Z99_10210 [Treponema sp. GWB1_62_6]|nr:MAG: hypothetical protein A2Y36_08200 [Treponema sp. GWA1_62_8]OHE64798.1 MAG: hypothetical protein A2001_04605 [Treponema sp. GWC1_61_84]OHE66322.1 MAG: hypothetical protein A2Z99_10210 [Treponema sp. GWB1_62_6]OHE73709.1 MAG: hypothetical protein A2413_10415 [Treponema sp. RIFOXYC1_FULL_61_9]
MVSAFQDMQLFPVNAIYQAVFLVDAPGPETRQVEAEGLGFSESAIGRAFYIADEFVDLF